MAFDGTQNHTYPCRCLCLGFSQITRTTPLRFRILHLVHIFRTEDRTFIVSLPNSFGRGGTGLHPLAAPRTGYLYR